MKQRSGVRGAMWVPIAFTAGLTVRGALEGLWVYSAFFAVFTVVLARWYIRKRQAEDARQTGQA